MLQKIKEQLQAARLSRLLPPAAALLFIVLTGVIYRETGSRSPLIFIAAALLYLILVLLFGLLSRYAPGAIPSAESEALLGGMSLDLIVRMNVPVMICNSSETVIWYNACFSSLLGKRDASGIRFETFCGLSLSELRKVPSEEGLPVEFGGRRYSVRCYPVVSGSKRYYLTLWEDRTALDSALTQLREEETLVAYVVADNLEELSQYAKDGTRTAAAEIEQVLKDWAEGANGILKEYQSDRYLFLFRAAEMEHFIEKKFDVLDRIREIRVGESSLSVTVSMGIAQTGGTLAEKERVAAEALDMALQRGGDQAVVKNAKGMEFYGGRTQTVQKRTKVRARVIANELAALISGSSHVIIMGHRAPDFDCIGACVGIARLASFCGVGFHIVVNRRDPNFEKCRQRLAGIPEYRDHGVFSDAAEAQELIGSDTLTVIVDVNNKAQLEAPTVAELSHRTVYIDHHRKTAEFEEAPLISYIEPSASSACELVAEILEQAVPTGHLVKEEADIMYSGILLDTKQFTRNAGVRTFSAALYLRGEGANPASAQTLFKADLSDFISEAKFESNVILYRRMMAICCSDGESSDPSDRISAAKAADRLLTVEGVKASFALCRIGEKIHISARSSGEINVQLILEKLEGGGHFDSAATQLNGSMTEALTRLKGAIDEYMDGTSGQGSARPDEHPA